MSLLCTRFEPVAVGDDAHPTTAGNGFIADSAFSALVPESGGLTLASVCAIGLALGTGFRAAVADFFWMQSPGRRFISSSRIFPEGAGCPAS
jgi:hypothetical protein